MRSSVTVMFSNPPPDVTMHYPDYRQKAEDHSCMLILVRPIGNWMSARSFNSIFDRINRLQHIKIPETQTGGQRGIWVRYKKHYLKESNDWGDFQVHRKVLGLICIGKCNTQDELDSLCKEHETVRDDYIATLFDSRCVVFKNNESKSSSVANQPTLNHDATNLSKFELSKNNDGGGSMSSNEETPEMEDGEISIDRDSGVFDAHNTEMTESLRGTSPIRTLQLPLGTSLVTSGIANSAIGATDPSRVNTRVSSPTPSANDTALSLLASAIPSPTHLETSPMVDGSPTCMSDSSNSTPSDHSNSSAHTPCSQRSDCSSDSSSHLPKSFLQPHSRKTTTLYYQNQQESMQLEQDLHDFICSLFWVLESKRLDRSHEKLDRLPMMFAPFERKDYVGLDLESRTNKKRCIGRMKKHIGDLCLLAGLPSESISYYNTAVDHLKSASDWLWLAGCFEGLCSASLLLLYPHNRWLSSIQRNSSFTSGTLPSYTNKLKPGGFSSLPNGLDPVEYKVKTCLTSTEVVEKYKDAIGHYHKYHGAAVIETEASIKCCNVLIRQGKYLQAAEFLHNVVSIPLQLSEEEKIRKFAELSYFYKQIGFLRKAAFYKRIAAMRCIAPQRTNPNWTECYHLLLTTLEGYKLSLDPKLIPKVMYGWPVLQIQILQELVATSRRMGNTALSVRHMTFLLHSMFDYLSPTERSEFAHQLEKLTARCEGAPVPLALDNGYIIPPVNLINLPKVKSFKLQSLASNLEPAQMVPTLAENLPCGPFIFSPLQFSTTKDKNRNSAKLDYKWVEGDVCEVSLQVYNPLPFELKVTNMGLLPDGIAFETFPASLSLPAESGPFPVNLLGTPRSTGELIILGYTTHVLGVKSNCRLKDIPTIKKPSYIIDVVPALPQLQVVTSLPKSPLSAQIDSTSSVVASAHLSLFAGESSECIITLLNAAKENVEFLDVFLDSKFENDFEKELCKWNAEEIKACLPVVPNQSASFTVTILAVCDFLGNSKSASECNSETASMSSTPSKKSFRTSSLSSFGSSRSSFAYSSLRGRFPELFSMPAPLPPPTQPVQQTNTVEGSLKVRYSGGPGYAAGYCRQCSVAFHVEIIPSLVIKKWDVLPAESPKNCYLVLDILNTTDHEMEVQYADLKRILIEAHDTCRIPVPVARCPLTKLSGLAEDEMEKVCSKHVAELVDLQWHIPATEANGKASISSLSWSSSMLDIIKMCPVQWNVILNERPFKPENDFTFPVGEMVNISIVIFNYSDATMVDLILTVQWYQDYQNGKVTYNVDGKLVMSGCEKGFIAEIVEQASYRHSCGVIFFCPGIYKLDVQCRSHDGGPSLAGLNSPCASMATDGRASGPPIEITVIDH